MLDIICWAFLIIFVLGIVILIIEIEKKKESRNGMLQVASAIVLVIAVCMVLVTMGISSETDIARELEDNQVYYLNATVPAPDNPQLVSLIVLKADTMTGELKNPIIIVSRISKDELAQDVEPGKYIKKSAQGRIDVWTAPIKT